MQHWHINRNLECAGFHPNEIIIWLDFCDACWCLIYRHVITSSRMGNKCLVTNVDSLIYRSGGLVCYHDIWVIGPHGRPDHGRIDAFVFLSMLPRSTADTFDLVSTV